MNAPENDLLMIKSLTRFWQVRVNNISGIYLIWQGELWLVASTYGISLHSQQIMAPNIAASPIASVNIS